MDLQKMMKPIWETGTIYNEACFFLKGVQNKLLYEPVADTVCVKSYDGTVVYEQGCDYIIEGNVLVLTPQSRIACACEADLILADREQADEELRRMGRDLGFGPVAMDDGRYITLRGIDHPEYLAKWTVMVSYEPLSSERIQAPFDASAYLPKWTRKRKEGEDCQIVLYGDSISYGCDCSGLYHMPPDQPVWGELVRQYLESTGRGKVSLENVSMPSADTEWAIEHCEERLRKEWRPDLVILGFGMNDRCSAAEYADRTKRLVQCVQQQYPEAEVLLIVTTLPNARVSTPPIYFCAQQHTFPDVLFNMKKDGIGVADVQGVQTQIMQQKSYLDLTANYLNHPNDYLARIQAQTVVQALGAWHKA